MTFVPASEHLLRTRAREVMCYLRFLRTAVERNATLSIEPNHGKLSYPIPRQLTNTLKANLYLLLYNVMEATFVQLIDEVHEVVGRNADNVDALEAKLFLQILRSFKSSNMDVDDNTVGAPIGRAILRYWHDEWSKKTKGKEKRAGLVSGNVDGLLMHRRLHSYGVVGGDKDKPFPTLTHKALELSKNRRNLLAHGDQGFAELGRNYAVEELFEDARNVFKTLARIAQHVNRYLCSEGYFKDSTWQGLPQ